MEEVAALAPSAWRCITLDIPTRKYQTPRVGLYRLMARRMRGYACLTRYHGLCESAAAGSAPDRGNTGRSFSANSSALSFIAARQS